eukprot:gene1801-2134_t
MAVLPPGTAGLIRISKTTLGYDVDTLIQQVLDDTPVPDLYRDAYAVGRAQVAADRWPVKLQWLQGMRQAAQMGHVLKPEEKADPEAAAEAEAYALDAARVVAAEAEDLDYMEASTSYARQQMSNVLPGQPAIELVDMVNRLQSNLQAKLMEHNAALLSATAGGADIHELQQLTQQGQKLMGGGKASSSSSLSSYRELYGNKVVDIVEGHFPRDCSKQEAVLKGYGVLLQDPTSPDALQHMTGQCQVYPGKSPGLHWKALAGVVEEVAGSSRNSRTGSCRNRSRQLATGQLAHSVGLRTAIQ